MRTYKSMVYKSELVGEAGLLLHTLHHLELLVEYVFPLHLSSVDCCVDGAGYRVRVCDSIRRSAVTTVVVTVISDSL